MHICQYYYINRITNYFENSTNIIGPVVGAVFASSKCCSVHCY